MGKRDSNKSAVSLVLPPSIFLGPRSAASSKPLLTKHCITHVLSVGANPDQQVEWVFYRHIPLNDSPSSSISKVCGEAYSFIDTALASNAHGGKILVHCSAGISRSPTVLAAYLMHKHHMSLKQALKQIVDVRPQVCPNPGFLRQLKDLEKEIYGTTESSLDIDELPKKEKDRLAVFADVAPWNASSK